MLFACETENPDGDHGGAENKLVMTVVWCSVGTVTGAKYWHTCLCRMWDDSRRSGVRCGGGPRFSLERTPTFRFTGLFWPRFLSGTVLMEEEAKYFLRRKWFPCVGHSLCCRFCEEMQAVTKGNNLSVSFSLHTTTPTTQFWLIGSGGFFCVRLQSNPTPAISYW